LSHYKKNYDCVDAFFKFGKYDIENDSYQKLIGVYLYNFFLDGNLTIIKKEEIPSHQESLSRICLSCNMTIDIYASDNKHFSYNETVKFVSGVTDYSPFPLLTPSPKGYYPNKILNLVYIHRLTSFDLCKNVSKSECIFLMCKKISEKYSDFPCDSFTNQSLYFISNHFSDKRIVL
ncbi:MAG: hypothetical protein M1416_01845, partial [Candidatus Pacearchaeota archaeon]|nr:hypothetical protein [Candidatus Pacearchaeota archaeon]